MAMSMADGMADDMEGGMADFQPGAGHTRTVEPEVSTNDRTASPGWLGRLSLSYRRDGTRTVAHDRHEGPLRVLQPLYPEGEAICQHVLVHPPGGVVGGDRLEVDVDVQAGAHALITTPGATRLYRSEGAAAEQHVSLRVARGARLEWLPLETIAYSGCIARSLVTMALEDGAECIGWDMLALGLPAARQPFERGEYTQHIEWPGRWLEHARIAAADTALLDGPTGWAGQRVLATLWFARGGAWPAAEQEALLEAARAVLAGQACGGATAPQPGLIVLRLLAAGAEPALHVLAAVRAAWRNAAWGCGGESPRIWRT